MELKLSRLLALFAALLAAGSVPAASLSEVFCNSAGQDDRTFMPPTTALPWGAVGYMDNGCTATLIDPRHILAAGHCFAWFDSGAWQGGLYFVPNFSPTVAPRFVFIDRAVVGTRAELESLDTIGLDWGIGHLAEPVTDYPSIPIQGPPSLPSEVASAGYGRDLAKVQPSPRPAGAPCVNPFCVGGQNVWWDEGLVDPRCTIWRREGNFLLSDCAAVGGNSGSPLVQAVGGGYRIAGVIRGGGFSVDRSTNVVSGCTQLGPSTQHLLNNGPPGEAIASAPLAATGVGVARSGSGSSQVFVVDRDGLRIVARTRAGDGLDDDFASYSTVTSAPRLAGLAVLQRDGVSTLVSVRTGGKLFELATAGPGRAVAGWRRVGQPPAKVRVRDLDALDGSGELYVVTLDGKAYRRRLTGSGWGSWVALPGSGYRRISAVERADGVRVVLLTRWSGELVALTQKGSAWGSPFGKPQRLGEGLLDVDATLDRFGTVRLFGLDTGGGLWAGSSQGSTWSDWVPWQVRLFAPLIASQASASPDALAFGYWKETTGPPLDAIVSLSATQWREGGSQDATVVFALDWRGNVYWTEPRCKSARVTGDCPQGFHWTGWRPFT